MFLRITDWTITCQSVNKSIKVATAYLVSKLSRENVFSCKWRITKELLSRVCKEKLSGIILKPEQKEAIIPLLNGKEVFAFQPM